MMGLNPPQSETLHRLPHGPRAFRRPSRAAGTQSSFTACWDANPETDIAGNDSDEAPSAIPVIGIGAAAAQIQVAAAGAAPLTSGGSAVDFGTANAGATGAVKTFTIRNSGTATLTGLKLKLGEGFSAAFPPNPTRRKSILLVPSSSRTTPACSKCATMFH